MKRRASTFALSPKLYEQLTLAAKREHRSVSNLIEVIALEYLKQKYNIDLTEII